MGVAILNRTDNGCLFWSLAQFYIDNAQVFKYMNFINIDIKETHEALCWVTITEYDMTKCTHTHTHTQNDWCITAFLHHDPYLWYHPIVH